MSLPASGKELGRGNVWLPLKAFRCGTSEVKVLVTDEAAGLLAAGDESGLVVLWEAYDTRTGRGAADVLLEIYEDTDDNGETCDSAPLYAAFQPNDFREVLRVQLGGGGVSSLLLLPSTLSLFVGTEEGAIYSVSNFHHSRGKTLKALDRVEKASSTGAVLGFHFAQYSTFGTTVPSVFAYFAAGQLSVLELNTMSCLAYYSAQPAGGSAKSDKHDHAHSSEFVSEMAVLNAHYDQLAPPTLLETTQSVSAAAAAASASLSLAASGGAAYGTSGTASLSLSATGSAAARQTLSPRAQASPTSHPAYPRARTRPSTIRD